jgi:hypothetical protein
MSTPAAPSCRAPDSSTEPGELAVEGAYRAITGRGPRGPDRHVPVSGFALTDSGAAAASCPRKRTHAYTEKEQHR